MLEPQESKIQTLQKRLDEQIHALNMSAIVATTDARGVIQYANAKFCELSQYSSEELVGQTHQIINSGYHDREFFKNLWQTISQGMVWRGEICNRAKDGSLYWVDTTIVPFLGPEGKPLRYISIRYDITHKKETERELEEEKLRLIESEKMAGLGILSSGIAHELGNPLGAIRGRLEMLEAALSSEGFDPEKAKESIGKMIHSVDRMSKIIRGLKSYARDGSHDAKEPFDLTMLVTDILEISKQKCQRFGIEVKTQGLDHPVMLMGRETEVGQVVVNLFNNACDAIRDLEKRWISLEVKKTKDLVEFCVRDSGSGIPLPVQHKMFDPFFTTKEVGKGTGLGLSIYASIVKRHGGELFIKNGEANTCICASFPHLSN
ncbi:MAG: PAS domain-containing sensor histidine kinase [Bdellovibrionales bacterium]|nr:PAS domain-containing sensor histidine kinase [Bdellovibrionales bacterium]